MTAILCRCGPECLARECATAVAADLHASLLHKVLPEEIAAQHELLQLGRDTTSNEKT
jgi:hypothetical protein